MGWLTTQQLNDVAFTLCAIAGALTLSRLYIRYRSQGLGWDDFFCVLALVALIVSDALPFVFDSHTALYWQLGLAEYMLLWTTLWCVKASFLALCWKIFHVLDTFRNAWFVVAVFTFVSFWPPVLWQVWQCGGIAKDYDNPPVCLHEITKEYALIGAAVCTALHVSSELFILALPVMCIKSTQMSRSRKLSAIGVFTVVLVIIILGLLRNIAFLCLQLDYNVTTSKELERYMQALEPPLAVIVCTLPAHRAILTMFGEWRRERKNKSQEQGVATAEVMDKPLLEASWPKRTVEGSRQKRTIEGMDSIAELEMV